MIHRLTVLMFAAACAGLLAGCGMVGGKDQEAKLVDQYDQLSKEILKSHPNETEAQKKSELEIMKGLMEVYKTQADCAFETAKKTDGAAQGEALGSAIVAVTKISQEGDTRIDAIKNQLRKGGHHHSKAEGSDEEYIFVNSKAKKELTAQANKLRELKASGKTVSLPDIEGIQKVVNDTYDGAMKGK